MRRQQSTDTTTPGILVRISGHDHYGILAMIDVPWFAIQWVGPGVFRDYGNGLPNPELSTERECSLLSNLFPEWYGWQASGLLQQVVNALCDTGR